MTLSGEERYAQNIADRVLCRNEDVSKETLDEANSPAKHMSSAMRVRMPVVFGILFEVAPVVCHANRLSRDALSSYMYYRRTTPFT